MNVRKIINEDNIKIKKQFGQNFLIDQNILQKIVDEAQIENQNVIEIGPGLGSLTERLVQKAKKVVCYEIDADMVAVLEKNYWNHPKLTILNQDFLKVNLKKDIETYFKDEEVIVVANLPYYITTAILTKIIEETSQITKMIVMMQKEVAMRLAGKPSTKDYNGLSVLIQYYMTVQPLFFVSPQCFHPAPMVESSVIAITRKTKCLPVLKNETFFLTFNRAIFSQRRKTLYNNIKQRFLFSKEQIEKTLTKNNLSLQVRAEQLTVEQIVNLANDFSEYYTKV